MGNKQYKAFDGKFLYWHIALGKGAYGESKEELEKFKKIATVQGYEDEKDEADKDDEDGNKA